MKHAQIQKGSVTGGMDPPPEKSQVAICLCMDTGTDPSREAMNMKYVGILTFISMINTIISENLKAEKRLYFFSSF